MILKKQIKRIISLMCAVCLVLLLVQLPSKVHAAEKLTGKTSMEITKMMGKGWNLGNTFDANGGNKKDIYSQETSWGNPKVTAEQIQAVKDAGFNTIRIPTTWYRYIDDENNYKIADEWMARITEVVDYAYAADLFIILNVHHEPWINTAALGDDYVAIGKKLYAVWSQIAENFKDYDQHLIFEGMNEPRAANTSYEWTGSGKEYEAVNYLDQQFVNAVRDNGQGYNSERALMVPDYAASSSSSILRTLVLPTYNGVRDPNLIVSVHCYDPYNFCLQDTQLTFNPKSSADTSGITGLIKNLNTLFIENGIPAVIGECGATNSRNNNDARLLWFDFMGKQTRDNEIPAIVWDNGVSGTSGGECHKYIDRKKAIAYAPDLIEAFISGMPEQVKKAENTVITFEPYKGADGVVLVNPFEAGFLPKDLHNKAQINHTPDAAIGYSMEIPSSVENQTVTMDISHFKDKNILVKAYVYSPDNDVIKAGVTSMISSANPEALATVTASNEWTQISFVTSVDGNAKRIYFTGEAGKTYYVDDFEIEIDGKLDDISSSVQESDNSDISNDTSTDSTVSNDSESVKSPETKTDASGSEESGHSITNIIILMVGVILIFAAVKARSAKKANK